MTLRFVPEGEEGEPCRVPGCTSPAITVRQRSTYSRLCKLHLAVERSDRQIIMAEARAANAGSPERAGKSAVTVAKVKHKEAQIRHVKSMARKQRAAERATFTKIQLDEARLELVAARDALAATLRELNRKDTP